MAKKNEDEERAVSRNIMVNKKIDNVLEDARIINKGMSTETLRSRSDVYNEILGLGVEIYNIKRDLGEKEFSRVWTIINKLDLKKVDLDKII